MAGNKQKVTNASSCPKKVSNQFVSLHIRLSLKVAPNVLVLGAVADFGARNFHLTTKVDVR